MQNKLIFWTGEKHCGKTTSAARLAKTVRGEGFSVCGLLAPCVYHNDEFIGFDVFDLHSHKRAPLARSETGQSRGGPFKFIDDGLRFGNAVLSAKETQSADFVIVDEFGRLELEGLGWRRSVDLLLDTSDALILLVVRLELVEAVRQLYADYPCRKFDSADRNSVDEIVTILKSRRYCAEKQNVQA